MTLEALVEVGAHFGHQTKRWNPKMRRYIFAEENGVHIIDLSQTVRLLQQAAEIVRSIAVDKRILFVGTKKQAKEAVKAAAEGCHEFYVCERWLGGMLTNLSTIRKSIKKLEHLEKKLLKENSDLTKKERNLLSKEQVKLEKNLSGIRSLRRVPGLLIVVDPTTEHIAILEAKKLGIPVMAIVDTNCDPSLVDYPIPANDDAQKSIKLILDYLMNTIEEAKKEAGYYEENSKLDEEKVEKTPRRNRKGKEAPAEASV